MNILFWNIKGNSVASYVARCALENNADVICLAEHLGVRPDVLCSSLGNQYRWVSGVNDSEKNKVILFARSDVRQVSNGQLLEPFHRCVIWSFECDGEVYNLVALHLVDRGSEPDPNARHHDATMMMAELLRREKQSGCENSIVIGDFNSDPFEAPLVAKDAFNATLFDVINSHPVRRRYDEEFRMMYNPVVHYLSEETKCYGSFYWGKGFSDLYWHCYDQALVSPSLADRVRDFRYLRAIDEESLLAGVKPKATISDHLPLLLTIGGTEHEQ